MSTTAPVAHAMAPQLGRALWQMLHAFAAGYPLEGTPEARVLAMTFLVSFKDSLMRIAEGKCPCRTVLANAMKHYPVPLTGRVEFVAWTRALHELVNLKLGKGRFMPALQHPMLTAEAWRLIMPPNLPVPASLIPRQP